jgi:hypothetical protein
LSEGESIIDRTISAIEGFRKIKPHVKFFVLDFIIEQIVDSAADVFQDAKQVSFMYDDEKKLPEVDEHLKNKTISIALGPEFLDLGTIRLLYDDNKDFDIKENQAARRIAKYSSQLLRRAELREKARTIDYRIGQEISCDRQNYNFLVAKMDLKNCDQSIFCYYGSKVEKQQFV